MVIFAILGQMSHHYYFMIQLFICLLDYKLSEWNKDFKNMIATFANKLEMRAADHGDGGIVFYDHSLRCPVDVWFEKSDKNKFGWVVQFKAPRSSILDEFRTDIFRQAVKYIERRARRPVTEVSFADIMSMANALEVKHLDLH